MQYRRFLAKIKHDIYLIYHILFLWENQESCKVIGSANRKVQMDLYDLGSRVKLLGKTAKALSLFIFAILRQK